MNRLVSFLAVSFLLSACGPAGRCMQNSECPVGASCDASIGVCVMPQAADTKSAGLAANYSHACSTNADCADVAGTSCYMGMCVSPCETAADCKTGSYCGEWTGHPYCFKACEQTCGLPKVRCNLLTARIEGATPGLSLCGRAPEEVGGQCEGSSDCAGSLECLRNSSGQQLCSRECTADASVCGDGTCVTGSSGKSFCYAKCAQPGTQSTCRTGFSCRTLTGASFGACM